METESLILTQDTPKTITRSSDRDGGKIFIIVTYPVKNDSEVLDF